MKSANRIRRRLFLVLCFVLFAFAFPSETGRYSRLTTVSLEEIDKIALISKAGDLIFRRIDSGGSTFVLLADSKPEYSHVGIVWKSQNETYVIHVVPSEDSSPSYVKITSVEDYIRPATSVAVYRLKNADDKSVQNAAEVAYRLIGKVSFDMDFDLSTDSRQYCTELIWKIYKKIGVDLVDGQFDTVHFVFLKTDKVVFVSSLLHSRWLMQVYLK